MPADSWQPEATHQSLTGVGSHRSSVADGNQLCLGNHLRQLRQKKPQNGEDQVHQLKGSEEYKNTSDA